VNIGLFKILNGANMKIRWNNHLTKAPIKPVTLIPDPANVFHKSVLATASSALALLSNPETTPPATSPAIHPIIRIILWQ